MISRLTLPAFPPGSGAPGQVGAPGQKKKAPAAAARSWVGVMSPGRRSVLRSPHFDSMNFTMAPAFLQGFYM